MNSLKLQLLKKKYFIFYIFLVAFVLRLYRISNPLADWHSFRQADTASVTREYVKNGIDLLRPRYHDLSNIQSGENNLEGYRMVEFPFINGSIAFLLRALPFLQLELTSRLISILFSLATIGSLFVLVKTVTKNRNLALLSSFFMAVLPYSVYYSRVVLPEPYMLFFSTFSLMSYSLWLKEKKWRWYWLSLAALSLALLLKPFVLFLGPVYLSLGVQNDGWRFLKRKALYPYIVLSLAPLYFWRKWIQNFPEGIPVSDWLLNGNGIRLKPAWFRWLFYERIAKLILGFTGVIFLIANFLKIDRDFFVYGSWWIGMVLYFVVVASGNVQHDYYQVLLVPILSISMARGVLLLNSFLVKKYSKKISSSFIFILVTLTLILAWNQVKGYFNVNHWEYIEAGMIANQLLPLDAKIIAPAFGDTVFLFQTQRTGWPIGFDIEEKRGLGATHYITTSYDNEARELETKYETITKTEKFLLLDLTKEKKQPL